MSKSMLFVTPYAASDEGDEPTGMDALDSLLDKMEAGTPPETPPAGDDSQGDENTEGAQNSNESEDTQQQGQHSAEDKRNFAFGKMRTEINQLTELLGKVAKANGVDYSDSKDLIAKLNDDAIQKMAQRQNVPVEILQELDALRRDSEQFKAQQRRDAAAIGFQRVMDTYNLTQDQLKAFAVELDQKGKNPFEQNIDLMEEYKILHYDDILNAAVKKAVEEALKKDSAANQSSSTPGQQQGGSGGEPQKISTVAGLTALLNDVKV
jgi:hypothetical protein